MSFTNIRNDGVQKVANSAERLALLPSDGYVVEQLDDNSLWAFHQATNTWVFIGGGAGVGTVTSVGLSLPVSVFSISGSPVTTTGTLTGTFQSQTGNKVFASPDGAPGTPTFRSLVAADIPALSYVSSVGLSLPSIFSVSGSPVTNTGTLTGTLAVQAANLVFAGPATGVAATPTFRALTATDIPTLGYISSLNGLTAATQTFAVGSTGTDFTISSSLSTHTFNMPSASGTARGLVNTGTQTFAGDKTFSGNVFAASVEITGTGGAGYERLAFQSSAPSGKANFTTVFGGAAGQFGWIVGTSLFGVQFNSSGITANRAFVLQDLAGTVSLQTGSGTALTSGSCLFSNTTGLIDQDNATYFWDATNKRLGLGTNSALTGRLHIKGEGATSSTNALIVTNSTPTTLFTCRNDGLTFAGNPSTASLGSVDTLALGVSTAAGGTSSIGFFVESKKASSSTTGSGIQVIVNDGAALTNGDRIGFYGFAGSTTAAAISGTVASMESFCVEAWSASANGSDLRFYTIPNTTTTKTERMRIHQNGNVSIGTTAIGTARLHLTGGTATASTAPLKFTSGTLLTVPEAGVEEFDGTYRLTTGNSVRYAISGNINSNTTTTGNSAGTLTALFNYTVPGNTLAVNGDMIDMTASGTFATSASVDKQIQVIFGGTTLYDTGALAITAGASWFIRCQIFRTGAATQKTVVTIETSSATLVASVATATAAETLSGGLALKINGKGTNLNDVTGLTFNVINTPIN